MSYPLVIHLLLGIATAFLWLSYFRLVDIFRPEKWYRLLFSLASGFVALMLVWTIRNAFTQLLFWPADIHNRAASDFVLFALLCEGIKFVMAISICRWIFKSKEPVDYLIHAAAVALGFALAENIISVMDTGAEINPWIAGFYPIAQICCTVLPVYAYVWFDVIHKKRWTAVIFVLMGLFGAVLLHLGYLFTISFGGMGVLLLLILYWLMIELWLTAVNNLLNFSPFFMKNVVQDYTSIQKLLIWGFIGIGLLRILYRLLVFGTGIDLIYTVIGLLFFSAFLVLIVLVKFSRMRLIPKKKFSFGEQFLYTFELQSFISNGKGTFSSALYGVRMDSVTEMEISKMMYTKLALHSIFDDSCLALGIIDDKLWFFEDEVYFQFKPEEPVEGENVLYLKAQTKGHAFWNMIYPIVGVLKPRDKNKMEDPSLLTMADFYTIERYYLVPELSLDMNQKYLED